MSKRTTGAHGAPPTKSMLPDTTPIFDPPDGMPVAQFLRDGTVIAGGGSFAGLTHEMTRRSVAMPYIHAAAILRVYPDTLTDTVICNKDLRGFSFAGQNLRDSGFLECNLGGADFRGARFWETRFEGSNLDGAQITVIDDRSGATGMMPCFQYMSQLRMFRGVQGTPHFYTTSGVLLDADDCRIDPETGKLVTRATMPKLLRGKYRDRRRATP